MRTQYLRYTPIRNQTQSRFIQNTPPRLWKNDQPADADTKQGPFQDEDIPSEFIQVVNDEGKLEPPQRLSEILDSLNRNTHFVVQVSPGAPEQPPICRILNKQAVREYIRAKEKAAHVARTSLKQIELNWAIDSHDLSHRLKQLTDFLKKGRKVEILLTRKRRKRAPTPEEIKHLMNSVMETTQKADGMLVKPIEGEPGKQVLMIVKRKDL